MSTYDVSLQLTPEVPPQGLNPIRKAALAGVALGMLGFASVTTGAPTAVGWGGLTLLLVAAGVYIYDLRNDGPPGIKNNFVMFGSVTNRGMWGWFLGVFMTGFYIVLYFYSSWLAGLIELVDPIKVAISGSSAISVAEDGTTTHSPWFLYGFLYTLAILVMGFRAFMKFRHSRYQIYRTISVMAAQLLLAFILPDLIANISKGNLWFDWKNIWPLNYYAGNPWTVEANWNAGVIGQTAVFVLLFSILIATPILTYFYGKRWYCSWVCGCGGLAETLGDPWRQLSDKSMKAWKIERWMIHGVLVLVFVTTGAMYLAKYNWWGLGDTFYSLINVGGVLSKNGIWLYQVSDGLNKFYGFMIMSIFSGVVGTGFYPILGSRVWCRFGCPMAAILGLFQRKFSRFRITTNGGQCISCGNCSTYCEMGIDVRAYAQRGDNIVRASCVGCGLCSAVCPRGVLNLENGPMEGRFTV